VLHLQKICKIDRHVLRTDQAMVSTLHAAAVTAHQVQVLPCLLPLLLLVRLLVLTLLHCCLLQTAVQLRWAAQAARLLGPWE
jgi:hypothetical protein